MLKPRHLSPLQLSGLLIQFFLIGLIFGALLLTLISVFGYLEFASSIVSFANPLLFKVFVSIVAYSFIAVVMESRK